MVLSLFLFLVMGLSVRRQSSVFFFRQRKKDKKEQERKEEKKSAESIRNFFYQSVVAENSLIALIWVPVLTDFSLLSRS